MLCSHCLCSHIYFSCSDYKQLNGHLKGIFFMTLWCLQFINKQRWWALYRVKHVCYYMFTNSSPRHCTFFVFHYIYMKRWFNKAFATSVITCAGLCLKQMWRLTKAKTKMKPEHWTKRWNWSSCTKLALRASWTHGLIIPSVRASKQNSVVVGSNPT